MKKFIFITALILLSFFLAWSQGQIIRPHNSKTKEIRLTENVNGIKVHWKSNISDIQKTIIIDLLNSMVNVPGNSFDMGSEDYDFRDDERPLHKETIKSFKIGKFEVSQKIWQAIMNNNPSHFKGENLPVENVTYQDCQNFIQKLNQLSGLKFRLPTEAEWEYAARGGDISKGYKYSGSNNINEVGWYNDNSDEKTHAIGSKMPNELGLYDMTGNVMEWISDLHSINYSSPRNRPWHCLRGGSWHDSELNNRSTSRSHEGGTSGKGSDIGFRLVL